MSQEYFLRTNDEEIARLTLQHRVWRPRALDAWRRAGFTVGQTLLDLGCGPGLAAFDLADMVGTTGRIVAIDRSQRFLDALETTRLRCAYHQVESFELDLDQADLPLRGADGAWARWVFAFVKRPQDLVARVGSALKRGGVLVLHEYLDYSTWRLTPRSVEFEEFVRAVIESWRAAGGEPDVGLDLPRWLPELGFKILSLQPILDVIPASNFVWQWPKAFVQAGLCRLTELEQLTVEQAETISAAFAESEAAAQTLMVTPAVLEIIAVRQ